MTGGVVTTNPVLIMVINMTIVFAVLFLVGVVIKLIHMLDPTKPKEDMAAPVAEAVSAAAAAAEPAAVEMPMEEKELAAVITTAIMASGYQNVQIKSIKKV